MVTRTGIDDRLGVGLSRGATLGLLAASIVLLTSVFLEPSTRRSRCHQRGNGPSILTIHDAAAGPAQAPPEHSLARGAARHSALARAMVAAVVQPRCLGEVVVAQIGGLYGP